jgi:small-conductance mechanosensitive channel
MDIQQAINVRLHRKFAELGIEFAYPTQRLFIVPSAQPCSDFEKRAAA